MPKAANIFSCKALWNIRIDPPPISLPFKTISYALALIPAYGCSKYLAASLISGALLIMISIWSGLGEVNGWCLATQRLPSSSYSNNGKSMTHNNLNSSSFLKPNCFPNASLSSLMALRVLSSAPARIKIKSPAFAPVAAAMAFNLSSE